MADVLATQAQTLAAAEGADVQASQAQVLVAANYPSLEVRASQAQVLTTIKPDTEAEVSQAQVLVAVRGRVEDPHIRAWTFWLDGHWFYVLRLPTGMTLILDVSTEQWHIWGSGDSTLWRAFCGTNWLGAGSMQGTYDTNIVVGDDGNGTIYFLDPRAQVDDDALVGADTARQFLREVTGQLPTRSIDMLPCYGVHLMGSVGEVTESSLTAVTLFTSDDEGHTYDEHETIDVDPADYEARVDWWSLGSFKSPGRLFVVKDWGALQRIDWLDMVDNPDG